MFPKFKTPKSHVPHNGKGLVGAAEHLDEMSMGNVKKVKPFPKVRRC
jgi:hypothetical protein